MNMTGSSQDDVIYLVCMHVSMCGHMRDGGCDDDHVLVYNTFLIR